MLLLVDLSWIYRKPMRCAIAKGGLCEDGYLCGDSTAIVNASTVLFEG
jgi:hypothetical protein